LRLLAAICAVSYGFGSVGVGPDVQEVVTVPGMRDRELAGAMKGNLIKTAATHQLDVVPASWTVEA
jgi:hypothetical protein